MKKVVLFLILFLGMTGEVEAVESQFVFNKTSQINTAVVDRPRTYDAAPSVIQEGDVVKVWYCGGGDRGTQFFGHDSVFYTSYNIRTGAIITPPTRVISPALNDTAEDGDMACAVSVIKHQNPNIANFSGVKEAPQYKMYYECAPKVYNSTGPVGCYTQICHAASDDGIHWKKWVENVGFVDLPANPTAVIKISDTIKNNLGLQWQNGKRVITTRSDCDLGNNYGVGHPTAISLPPQSDGFQRIRLYYYDSKGFRPNRAMYWAESWDGFHFETPVKTNMLSVQKPKYVNVAILSYPGFYISTLGAFNYNFFNYSWDGVNWFWGDAGKNVDFYTNTLANNFNVGKVVNNCVIGTGNFIGDQYGRINSLQNVGFMSSDGKFGPSDNCTRDNNCACYSKEEDYEYCYDTNTYVPLTTYCANRGARGSTLGLYHLAGNLTFVGTTPTPISPTVKPTVKPTIKPTNIPVPPTATPTLIPGDYDGDRDVDLVDFGIWKGKYLAGNSTLVEFGVWKREYLK